MATTFKTPGVYIQEINAFPNNVVSVSTSTTGFVGYTQKAEANGQSLHNVPTSISSLAEFEQLFGGPCKAVVQVSPVSANVAEPRPGPSANFSFNNQTWQVQRAPQSRYMLHQSIAQFFANGGSVCFIVSVGNYSSPVELGDAKQGLLGGLQSLQSTNDVALLAIPDAVLLSQADCARLQQAMLAQCGKTQSRFAILDLWRGDLPLSTAQQAGFDPISSFRQNIGSANLSYGAAYYPWLVTTLASASAGGPSLSLVDAQGQPLSAGSDAALAAAALPHAQALWAILPPSATVAGIYNSVDNSVGVFQAPAGTNTPLNQVQSLCVNVTDTLQEGLNVSPTDGKSINALRDMTAYGLLVWGARTLDGNSQDWRYINVRRTVIMIEQSIKFCLNQYVFAANDANTWSLVQSSLNNYLNTLWMQGALFGSTPADAYSASIGLGSTMTGQDILDGLMIASVKVALTHQAEFIEMTFQQRMGG